MKFQTLGNKPERVFIIVKNAESSADIANNVPVAWSAADGLSVTTIKTAAAKLATSCLVGLSNGVIKNGKFGAVQVYGFVANCPSVSQTKASTDSTYATLTIDAGLLLAPDTANNAFSTAASVAASAYMPWGVASPVSTSFATAQGATGTGTLSTRTLFSAGFLRLM